MLEVLLCLVEIRIRDDRLCAWCLVVLELVVPVFEKDFLPDVEVVRDLRVDDIVVIRGVSDYDIILVFRVNLPVRV